jgi:hypothetical protein
MYDAVGACHVHAATAAGAWWLVHHVLGSAPTQLAGVENPWTSMRHMLMAAGVQKHAAHAPTSRDPVAAASALLLAGALRKWPPHSSGNAGIR